MKSYTVAFVAAFVAAIILIASADAQSFDIRKHLASKTPYYAQQDFSQHTPVPPSCKAIHLNLVARHGSRNPSDGDIEDFDAIIAQIQKYGYLISDQYSYIKNWTNPFKVQDESKLVLLGKQEHYDMSKRFQAAFPSLIGGQYDSDVVFFRATQEQRAMMSADSFGYGLFERKGQIGVDNYEPRFILSDSEPRDYILKYYDNCPLYNELVGDNDDAQVEVGLYEDLITPAIAARLTRQLGVGSAWTISPKEALIMWAACQAEAALFERYEWCALFPQAEVEQLEYLEDLDDYYTKAYPYEINYRMTAPLLQDLYNTMLAVIRKETVQKANLRFAHSSTVVSLLARFGLYKDTYKLTHDLPQSKIDARLFRTSVLSPMGTNLAAILYECEASVGITHKIKFLQNEKEYVVEGCDGVYCSFDTFARAYEQAINDEFEEICAIPNGKNTAAQAAQIPIALNLR